MKLSLISSLALATALSFSGAALAQTTVNGLTVSAEDLPKVQAQCDTLAMAATAEESTTSTNAAEENAPAGSTASGGSNQSENPAAPDASANATATIDLSAITLEGCKAAGLVK